MINKIHAKFKSVLIKNKLATKGENKQISMQK